MEPSGDPIWGIRSKRLQEWLQLSGPKTVEEIYREWAIGKMITETLLTNILAYAEGPYIIQIKGKWWAFPLVYVEKPAVSKEERTVPDPTSEERQEKSGSTEPSCPESGPSPPDLV